MLAIKTRRIVFLLQPHKNREVLIKVFKFSKIIDLVRLDPTEHSTRDARGHPVYYNGVENKTKMNPLGRSPGTYAASGTIIENSSRHHVKTKFKIPEIKMS